MARLSSISLLPVTTHLLVAIAMLMLLCPSNATSQDTGIGRRSLADKYECPPPGFDSVPNFDLKKYASAPWYPQRQVPNLYQQPDNLYCVRAFYELVNPDNLAEGVVVNNYANKGKVNGEPMGTSGSGGSTGTLLAIPDSKESGPTAASKLRVGPKALQKLPQALWYPLYGPYWVVAVGPSKNATLGYDWAIVLGGTPDVCGKTGCKPGIPILPSKYQYFGGLWLFARKPVDIPNRRVMMKKVKELGLDTSELLDVKQKGCKYQGA